MTIRKRLICRDRLSVTEIGFGASTLGNLYNPISDAVSRSAVDAAIVGGVGLFDTAPFYGFGLSERRLGDALRPYGKSVVSSKVGRLLTADAALDVAAQRDGFVSPMPFRPEYDYTYDGVLRSHEASLHRLGLARIDLLLVHDIGRANHGDANAHYWKQLTRHGGFRALEQLRDGGAITGFGLGVNETAVCMDALRETQLDVLLLAGRYTLLEQAALDDVLPACVAQQVAVLIGGPYNSGILATGTRTGGPVHYNYDIAPATIVERVRRIEQIAEVHGVPLPAAALQFPLAHPAVASVVPGLAGPEQVEHTLRLYQTAIPEAFWHDLRRTGLLRDDAPIPTGGVRS